MKWDPTRAHTDKGLLNRAAAWLGIDLEDQPWSAPMLFALVVGVLAIGTFALARMGSFWATLASATFLAGSALTVGALTGFVFGIPRAVQETTGSPGASGGLVPEYRTNTNLEQISDWLTKIVVGLGLTHLTELPKRLEWLAEYNAEAFPGPPVPASIVATAMVYFAGVGFLASYLWTRLLLTGAFSKADRAARESPEFLEGLVEALLYQPAPSGFNRAIATGESYLKAFGEGNWRVWRSLACAYAQQYGYLEATGSGDESTLASAREKALNAVKIVIRLNRDECRGLRRLWDPMVATEGENDLTVFSDDPGFAEEFRKCPE